MAKIDAHERPAALGRTVAAFEGHLAWNGLGGSGDLIVLEGR
jgi:hypothetical protein